MKRISAVLFTVFFGTGGFAQEPLSAIEWLNDASTATVSPLAGGILGEPPVAEEIETPSVQVTALDSTRADAVGLLPGHATGLPASLWHRSEVANLQRHFERLSPEPLPAVQALYYTLLLAEATAPGDMGQDAVFLTARLDALRRFGAVEPALALVEAAGPMQESLFDQWLDLSLLNGYEDRACAALARQPHLTNSLASRIFCTARAGDWGTAALIYDSAIALGNLEPTDQTLLALFLDPELVETDPPPAVPDNLTPLRFRLFEAIGTPLPTHNLPRVFANADLRGTAGWKAELEAAERLARTGALPATQLLGLYTARKPAASGGVWDRVAAIQALDDAVNRNDTTELTGLLPRTWTAMQSQRLEVPFADLFAPRLKGLDLPVEIEDLAFRITLLSGSYETAAEHLNTVNAQHRFLADLATGQPQAVQATTALEQAIASGFAATEAAAAHKPLLDRAQLGEAILSAAAQLDQSSGGARADISAAIATLRAVGLEETARRAAIQLLLLGARG